MPQYTEAVEFLEALREHARGRDHFMDMIPADSPPNFGYACTLCEGAFYSIPVQVFSATSRILNSDTLSSYFGTSEGRRTFPRALRNGLLDFTIDVLRSRRERAQSTPRQFNGDQAPETAPSIQVERYRRRPEVIEAISIPENGWYDVTGMGVTWLQAGLYLWSEMGLTSRETRVFHEQYELIPREDPNLVLVVGSSRHERDIDL